MLLLGFASRAFTMSVAGGMASEKLHIDGRVIQS